MRDGLLVGAIAGLLAAGLVVFSLGGGKKKAVHVPAGVLADVTVRRDVAGARIPPSFLGFSQEFNIAAVQTGTPLTGTDPVLVALFRRIAAFGSGVPALRIGGGSTDATWYSPSLGRAKPRGFTFTVTPLWLAGIRAFVERTNAPLIMGLNLGARDPKLATALVRAARAELPTRPAPVFELGNEPDVYDAIHVPGTGPAGPLLRKPPYGVDDLLKDVASYQRALDRLNPRPLLAGPAYACRGDCTKRLPHVLASPDVHFDLVTAHRYAMFGCEKKNPAVAIPKLLAPATLSTATRILGILVREARAKRLPLRVTETNSLACGGAPGISDVFASALWGADWSFALQAAGVTGVDFHGSSPAYAAYRVRRFRGRWFANVKPLYYGMLLFAEATAHRSRPLLVRTERGSLGAGVNLKVWAFYDATAHVVRIAVVNKDLRAGGTVRIQIPEAAGSAALKRLTAPAPTAKEGITWGGQHFAFATTDARLVGKRVVESISRGRDGTFRVGVPRASAALLTVRVTG